MSYEFSRNLERYAYNNPTIQPGEELSVRGFQMIHGPVRLERQVVTVQIEESSSISPFAF